MGSKHSHPQRLLHKIQHPALELSRPLPSQRHPGCLGLSHLPSHSSARPVLRRPHFHSHSSPASSPLSWPPHPAGASHSLVLSTAHTKSGQPSVQTPSMGLAHWVSPKPFPHLTSLHLSSAPTLHSSHSSQQATHIPQALTHAPCFLQASDRCHLLGADFPDHLLQDSPSGLPTPLILTF